MNVNPDGNAIPAKAPTPPEVVSVVKQVNIVPPVKKEQKEPIVLETNSSRTIPISSNTVEPGDNESVSDAYDSDDRSPTSQEPPQPMTSELFMEAPEPVSNAGMSGMSLNITELDRLMMDADISPDSDPVVVPDIVEAEIPDISSLTGPGLIDSHSPDTQKDKYKDKTVSELKAILEEKGLQTSGNKTKMIERILSSESAP